MVVILLLTPYATNGCDGGSNESSTISTTSTGDTAIPTINFKSYNTTKPKHHHNYQQSAAGHHQQAHPSNSSHNINESYEHEDNLRGYGINSKDETAPSWNCYVDPTTSHKKSQRRYTNTQDQLSPSPPPPPLPKTKPPYESYYCWSGGNQHNAKLLCANAIPKPPRGRQFSQANDHQRPTSYEVPPHADRLSSQRLRQDPVESFDVKRRRARRPPANHSNNFTNSTDIVRHVTRVNFYDIDTSQVEFEPKDDNDCDTEAITKDEEWITKRKTELTTTRQIETRVKRQVVLEDGKVVEDSGPIVSTNTTEDTDKQETETTEKRDLGVPENDVIKPSSGALDCVDGQQLAELAGDGGKLVKKMVARPLDGLVREIDEKRVISHEEIKDYLETEDVKYHGDFSDETYVKAVNSGVENLQEALLSPQCQQQLVPLGPRIIANTSKSRKTIDSEDTKKRSLAQADGTIVTEHKKTTEHEVIVDEELPEKDDNSTGSQEKITTVEAKQRYYKQRDEQNVDLIADGKVIGTEMRYAAETMQVEKDGSLERPGDWDSLSDRMRKLRRPHQKTLLQQHKEAALLADRKDALTKRPLDFDREEETRKGETMKWLESHFGSESTASNDSRDDDGEVEPTKKTYFNVTIKSNQAQMAQATTNGHRQATNTFEKKYHKEPETLTHSAARSKYYQGISNWTDRKETPNSNHFASKAFREDLQETVERNRLKKGAVFSSRDKLNEARYLVEPNDSNYVSREDIMQQKRQSISSQFLAKSRRNSRDKLDDLDTAGPGQRETVRNALGSRTDLRYGMNMQEDTKRPYTRVNSNDHNGNDMRRSPIAFNGTTPRRSEYTNGRTKSYENELNDIGHETSRYDAKRLNTLKSTTRSPSPEVGHNMHMQSSTLGRPTVPQRRRAIEKKLRQQTTNTSISPPSKVPFDHHIGDLNEPPPDYSPPPRSRSSSPQVDYITSRQRTHMIDPSAAYTSHAASTTTLTRKQNQRTRFAPTAPSPTTYHPTREHHLRPMMATATQTTQTTPSTISTSTAASHKSSRVGQVIGNSLRKLVSKIRSASAERKLRMKSRSKSREQSPSLQTVDKQGNNSAGSTTYQQYNVIDSHIGGQQVSNESEHESIQHQPAIISNKMEPNLYANSTATLDRGNPPNIFKRADSTDPYENDRDADQMTSPRQRPQRYYLGEDPYSSTLYGKENIYDPKAIAKRNRITRETVDGQRNNRESSKQREEEEFYSQRNVSSSTLGRYQKSGHRYAGSTPNLNQDYRTTQTLPRKLNDHHQHSQQQPQYQKATHRFNAGGHNTLGHPERRPQYQQAPQNSGPAKPARTYAKALNRSKSFNVHGMNGSNDPSPIYIEKLTKNNYNHNLYSSQAYKSNPHLFSDSRESSLLQSGLKSPSIVNLISRSQKDLSKIGTNENERNTNQGQAVGGGGKLLHGDEKKQMFLKGLHQQAPDLYKTLHGDEDYSSKATSKYQLQPKHSLDSRSPIEINKDTASIIRRGSSSNDDYVTPYNYAKSSELAQNKRIFMYKDDQKRRASGSGSTIIEVRNIESRK